MPVSTFISLDIDPEGDVYLCSSEFKLLVSSKVLSVASPVFKKLFGPHFLEGAKVSATAPGSVTLLEDDAKAMVALCQVIHHRSHKVATKPSFSFLEKVTIAADKYDCFQAMSQWGANYCARILQATPEGVGAGRLLLPSLLYGDFIVFRAVTKSIVYTLKQSEFDELLLIWSNELGSHLDSILAKTLLRTYQRFQHQRLNTDE